MAVSPKKRDSMKIMLGLSGDDSRNAFISSMEKVAGRKRYKPKTIKPYLFYGFTASSHAVEMNDGLRDRTHISMVKVPTMGYAAPANTDHPLLSAVVREKI